MKKLLALLLAVLLVISVVSAANHLNNRGLLVDDNGALVMIPYASATNPHTNNKGVLVDDNGAMVISLSGSASSADFSGLTAGTNSTAAMVVGTGASLATSGSGTIAATTAAALASNPTDCSSNQFANTIAANGNLTCSALTLAGAQFANQGTATTLLHGNASGNPSFAAASLTADVSGVLPPANGGVLAMTTAGVGMFCSPTVACIGATSTTTATNSNQVRVIKFYLPFRVTIRTVETEVTTNQSGKFYSVGIYNSACDSLLVDSGPISAASAVKIHTTVVGGAVTLDPGVYSYAFTTDGTTAVYRGSTLDANTFTLMNNTTTQMGTAANASVAGQLPSACGALSATTFAGQLAVWAP